MSIDSSALSVEPSKSGHSTVDTGRVWGGGTQQNENRATRSYNILLETSPNGWVGVVGNAPVCNNMPNPDDLRDVDPFHVRGWRGVSPLSSVAHDKLPRAHAGRDVTVQRRAAATAHARQRRHPCCSHKQHPVTCFRRICHKAAAHRSPGATGARPKAKV